MEISGTRYLVIAAIIQAALAVFCFVIGWLAAWKDGASRVIRIASLILSPILLVLLFSTRPVEINKSRMKEGDAQRVVEDRDLVKIELDKANQEIQFRIEQEESWFHYKFLLVGSMLAGFFSVFQFQRGRRVSLARLASSSTTCNFLSLACIVALAIDIHLRNNIVVIQQLALWITHYAEPALMPVRAIGFKPWESFLRTPGAGMHSDELYGLVFYPHLHMLTWVLYVMYLTCFQWSALKKAKSRKRSMNDVLLAGGFVLVHVALGGCAIVGHFVPGNLVLRVLPFAECWQTGTLAALFYFLLAVLLAAINSAFLFRLVLSPFPEKKA